MFFSQLEELESSGSLILRNLCLDNQAVPYVLDYLRALIRMRLGVLSEGLSSVDVATASLRLRSALRDGFGPKTHALDALAERVASVVQGFRADSSEDSKFFLARVGKCTEPIGELIAEALELAFVDECALIRQRDKEEQLRRSLARGSRIEDVVKFWGGYCGSTILVSCLLFAGYGAPRAIGMCALGLVPVFGQIFFTVTAFELCGLVQGLWSSCWGLLLIIAITGKVFGVTDSEI